MPIFSEPTFTYRPAFPLELCNGAENEIGVTYLAEKV